MQQVVAQYGADRNRVYVTGLSIGGHGAWDLMIKYNAFDGLFGRVFAAALPACGVRGLAGNIRHCCPTTSSAPPSIPTQAVIDELRGVPIWAVGGITDAPEFNRAVAAALPNSAYHYTELPLGHNVWDVSYPLPNGKMYYDWLYRPVRQRWLRGR